MPHHMGRHPGSLDRDPPGSVSCRACYAADQDVFVRGRYGPGSLPRNGHDSIAAIDDRRNSIGVEIDPGYFETAANRIHDRTGEPSFAEPAVADVHLE